MNLRDLRGHLRPVIGLLVICAVLLMGVYPAVLAGIDLGANPNAAQGSPEYCNGTLVGSKLIAQNVSSPKFFHPRAANTSDSEVDPDLPPAAAYAQVPAVANATGIAPSSLDYLIQQNINTNANENGFLAPSYVDVNALNLDLVQLYPTIYAGFCTG
jgi:potassium-transporting ATPase KdpC subunit